jgi:hypothetical protein
MGATFVLDGPLGEVGSSVAAAGLALSTTAAFAPLPDGVQQLLLECRNYSTAVVALLKLNPYLVVLKTQDSLATATDYSKNAQDGSAATDVTLSSQGTAAQGDFLYVGSHLPFRGVAVDVASAGAAIAVDGNVTWTVPTDWIPCQLMVDSAGSAVPHRLADLYWTRWEVSVALDSSTTLNSMYAMSRNKTTAGLQLVSGRVFALNVTKDVGGIGCIEGITDAGTANLLVNAATVTGQGFV